MSSDPRFEVEETPTVGIERPRSRRVERLERRVLCEQIEQLQRELERERRERQQIVQRYERLLAKREGESNTEETSGLLDRLFDRNS